MGFENLESCYMYQGSKLFILRMAIPPWVGNLYNCVHDPLLNACMTVPYHRGPMGVWPRIFVSLVQLSLVQYGNTLSARGCESNFGFQNAQWVEEHTWKWVTERRNDWSLLNFTDLGNVPPKKKQMEALLKMCCWQVFGWLGGVSFLVIVFSPSWCIFNGIFVNLWVVDILQPARGPRLATGIIGRKLVHCFNHGLRLLFRIFSLDAAGHIA